jgi:L-seryl-tRNA(Ser) seleniumtransferase
MVKNPKPAKADARRHIPAVDKVLRFPAIAALSAHYHRPLVVKTIQTVLEILRNSPKLDVSETTIVAMTIALLKNKTEPSLKKVINATGIVLHTGLGRAVLSRRAQRAVAEAAANYCNLELDLETGLRGSRQAHIEGLICELTGAEAALVVNNNAAAVLVSLNTLAQNKEVIVARGELVEIGGSFRMPEIMEKSGARLKEVGTTNRTRLVDFKAAITPETALVLKVHTSNYRIVGFTEEVTVKELVQLGLPVVFDQGSGILVPLAIGSEPLVAEGLKDGAGVITFSGDKLLGGPQSGIIAGKKEFIEKIQKNPLTRALRVCKLTIAALEATLREYLTSPDIFSTNPTVNALTKKITLPAVEHKVEELKSAAGGLFRIEAIAGSSMSGGGAFPLAEIPTTLIAISHSKISAEELAKRLRLAEPSIISRRSENRVLLDLRTIIDEDWHFIVEALRRIIT